MESLVDKVQLPAKGKTELEKNGTDIVYKVLFIIHLRLQKKKTTTTTRSLNIRVIFHVQRSPFTLLGAEKELKLAKEMETSSRRLVNGTNGTLNKRNGNLRRSIPFIYDLTETRGSKYRIQGHFSPPRLHTYILVYILMT